MLGSRFARVREVRQYTSAAGARRVCGGPLLRGTQWAPQSDGKDNAVGNCAACTRVWLSCKRAVLSWTSLEPRTYPREFGEAVADMATTHGKERGRPLIADGVDEQHVVEFLQEPVGDAWHDVRCWTKYREVSRECAHMRGLVK